MKHLLICLAGMLALGSLQADTYFSLEKAPGVLNAVIRPNQDVDLKLEENATAGYTWTAVYDARVCTVSIKHERRKRPASSMVMVDRGEIFLSGNLPKR